MKKIKKSNRGLTFTTGNPDTIGTKFSYFIDKNKKEIVIIPDENGTGTVSRKKSGKSYKPLYDIRSKEVKKIVSEADYLQVEDADDKIIVRTFKKVSKIAKAFKSNIIRIEDVFATKTSEIIVNKVVGTDYPQYLFGHPTLANDEYFETLLRQAPGNWNRKREEKQVKAVYDVISLFSGAGLFDYPFATDPNFRFAYAVDFDKDAVESYRENIGNHIECRDIRTIEAKELPNCDVIIGGPCCQGYSNSNRHNQDSLVAEEKRLLIEDYVRIVKEKQPKVFAIENVPTLLTKDNGLYLSKVVDNLTEYEFTITKIVDEAVGGYTKRIRAIIIGSKIGKVDLPDHCLHTRKTVKEALDKVDATWFNYNDVTEPRPETKAAMSYVPQGGNWKDIPASVHRFDEKTHSDRFRRLSLDGIAPCLTNWRKPCITHPTEDRILTVAEACALQGLDKNFHILGSTLNAKQQQVGNGVTQAIASFVKDHILEALNRNKQIVAFQ